MINILELVLTNILESDAESAETALRIFLHAARHADTASFRQRLQPGRDVDSITMYACTFNNIAKIDPYPEFDPPICGNMRIPLGHCALDLHGATQRAHSADKQH